MAPPRSRLAVSLALAALVAGAVLRKSVASAASSFLLSGERERELQYRLSQDKHVAKRFDDEFHVDILRFFSEREVQEATKEEYTSIPHPVIYTSQVLQQGVNCSNLQSEMHENYIDPEVLLYPEWIYESKLIGDCPTHYKTRELPPKYSPAMVLEAVCACGESQCSKSGHQCVPVSLHVPVWVRRGPNLHVLDVEEVTVACACAMRPSFQGNFIFSAAIQS
ncbi:uncharacterized protein LOC122246162 [Penaeus japonicus]|uniref:uncharacterized protein LOC122246162 n=1 Tax=Penaeus japonicus TaxID=27405 RepID=UPI001C712393|nr:uncharacterized protein LOC122246162 [Penaeus japonicus]